MIEAVPDRLEGAPRRVRREWSEAFKARLVAETLEPGANVSALARREGILPSQLFGWRRQAMRNGAVRPVEGRAAAQSVEGETVRASTIEIIVGGIVVRVGAQVDEAHLRRIIRAVRTA